MEPNRQSHEFSNLSREILIPKDPDSTEESTSTPIDNGAIDPRTCKARYFQTRYLPKKPRKIKPKIPWIEGALKRLSDRGISDQAHVEDFLLSLQRRNCRPNTVRSYFETIIQFLSFLQKTEGSTLETVTWGDLSAFIEHEQDRGLSPSSVNTRLKLLSSFLRSFIEQGIVHPDVLRRRITIRIPETLPKAIDPEDVKQLLSVIDDPRDWAMILVLLRSGMRIGELLNTKVQDLNFRDKTIEILEAEKTRVGRMAYVSDDAWEALKVWITLRDPEKEYLFYAMGRDRLGYSGARMRFIKYLEKAGLSQMGYTLHCLRHTFASELLNAGMRLECLQVLLGHSSIEMTRRYARLTDNTRREEYYRAMKLIEKGEIHGHYRFDHPVPEVSEEKELLGAHGQELHEHP